jgi:tetratricopeptide (TPR) repeat protein
VRTRFLHVLRYARLSAGVFFLLAAASGCALLLPQTEALDRARPAGLPERVELSQVPFFAQKEYECGPAALATVLVNLGADTTPDALLPEVYLPTRKGSLQVEMLAAARRHAMVSYRIAPRFEDLLREVAAGFPPIVLQDYGVWPFHVWHYAVVVGYDFGAREVVLRSGEKRRLTMPFAVLEFTWKKSDYWAMVVAPPGRIPVTAQEADYLTAVAALERVADPSAAASAYAAFLGRWPENLAASVGLANAYYKERRLAQAEATLRRAAAQHPDSVVVLNNLAQTLSDLGRNDEALRVIEHAAALGGPLRAAVEETRGTILQRIDRRR